jgi:Flp pilus assembly protein TadD
MLEADNRLELANDVYGAIDRGSPFSWPARLSIAANLNRLDRTDEAVLRLEAMGKENPILADSYINLGDILRGRDRFDEAISAYDRAFDRIAKLERRHWTLLYARGIALERAKKWRRAEADFLKALEFEPEQPYVLNYLGYSWIDQGLHLDRARKMIEKAVELRPNDGYIVDSMGWALYRIGDFAGAARELERAIELRPEDPVINDHLGDAYWKVGRRAEARFQWRRSLSLEPEESLRPAIKAKIDRGLIEGEAAKKASE